MEEMYQNSKLKEVELGPEAIEYAQDHLDSGKRLAAVVSKMLFGTQGKYTALVPSYCKSESIARLSTGGILKADINTAAMTHVLAELIQEYLNQVKTRICVIVDENALKGDPELQIGTVEPVYLDGDVHYIVGDYNHTINQIGDVIVRTWGPYYFAVVCDMKDSNKLISLARQIRDLDLVEIAENAEYVYFSAYDFESFIYWKRISS